MNAMPILKATRMIFLSLFLAAGFPLNLPVVQGPGSDNTVYLPMVINTKTSITKPIEILQNSTSFVDGDDYFHVVGEVANHTGSTLSDIRIGISFYLYSNVRVGSDYTNTILVNLPPNDRTCFEITLMEPFQWAYYQLEMPTYSIASSPSPELTILDHTGWYDPELGWYEVTGHVRNDTGRAVDFVSPVGTLYNAKGEVIGCDFTTVDGTNLDPFASAGFDLTFARRDFGDAAAYRLQVNGQ